MKKGRLILGLVLNILIVGAVGFGISNLLFGFWNLTPVNYIEAFRGFTNVANAFLGLAALIYIFVIIATLNGKKAPRFFAVLKLMATVAAATDLIIVATYLAPQGNNWALLYEPSYNLWVHLVAPVLGILAFIFENKPRLRMVAAFAGILPGLIYFGVMGTLVNLNLISAEPRLYDFMYFDKEQWWITVAWGVGILVGSYLLALILLALRSIGKEAEAVAKEEKAEPEEPKAEEPKDIPPYEEPAEEKAPEAEPAKEAEPAPVAEPEPEPEEPKPESKPEPNPEPKPAPKPEPKPEPKPTPRPSRPVPTVASRPEIRASAPSPVAGPRTYHITKQQATGRWQVKLAKGVRAIRVFDTQAEAIAFTKGLVESRGGSYRIHSVKGKIRK